MPRSIARWRSFPFNGGYHLMVMVIGSSTTVEYALKGVYEHTIGRLAEATVSGDAPMPEERLVRRLRAGLRRLHPPRALVPVRLPRAAGDAVVGAAALGREPDPALGAALRAHHRAARQGRLCAADQARHAVGLRRAQADHRRGARQEPRARRRQLSRLRGRGRQRPPRSWRRCRATSPSPPTAAGSPPRASTSARSPATTARSLVSLLVPSGWMSSAPAADPVRAAHPDPARTASASCSRCRVAQLGRPAALVRREARRRGRRARLRLLMRCLLRLLRRRCWRCCSWSRSASPCWLGYATLKRSQRERMTIEVAGAAGRALGRRRRQPPVRPGMGSGGRTGAAAGARHRRLERHLVRPAGDARGGRLARGRGRPAALRLQRLERPPGRARLFAPGAGVLACCT